MAPFNPAKMALFRSAVDKLDYRAKPPDKEQRQLIEKEKRNFVNQVQCVLDPRRSKEEFDGIMKT